MVFRALILGGFLSAFAQVETPIPQADPGAAPVGDTILFSVANPDSAAIYSWDFGDGNGRDSSSSPSARHAYAQPGRYTARVRAEKDGAFRSAALAVLIHRPMPARRPAMSSFLAMDSAGRRLFVSNADHGSVTALDLDSLRRHWEMPAGAGPAGLALAPDGTIWVACRDEDAVAVLRPDNGSEITRIALPYGSRPFGLAFDPAGGKAYLTLQGSGRLARLNAASRSVEASVEIGSEARHLALSPDGRAFVGRFHSPRTHGEVVEVDLAGLRVSRRIALAEDQGPDRENMGRGVPNYLEGLALSPDGTRLWVPAKKDNVNGYVHGDPDFKVFQNTVRAMAAVVDAATGTEMAGGRFDFDDSEGPAAVAFTPLGDPVFVAFRGSNKVQAFDPWRNGLLFSIPQAGLAPDALLVDGRRGRLYVHAALTREVRVYDVKAALEWRDNVAAEIAAIPTVAREALPAAVLRGKRVFHNAADGRMSRDGYMACSSCHFDGDSDGRVWDFTTRGEGLRRTLALWGRAGMGHGPVHWSANFDEIQDFEHDIRGPFGGAGFLDSASFSSGGRDNPLGGKKAGLSEDLDALAAYVASLAKVPRSPYRQADGSLSPDALAGREVFHRGDVGCAKCHVPSAYTDSKLPPPGTPVPPDPPADPVLQHRSYYTAQGFLLHDVGTLKPASGSRLGDTLKGLDTPTLLGLFAGGPYLHDGSAATVLDVITTANAEDRHGRTSHLSDAERRQLAAFLLSLDGADGGTGSIRPGRFSRGASTGGGPRLILDRRLGASPHVFLPLADRDAWTDLLGRKSRRIPWNIGP